MLEFILATNGKLNRTAKKAMDQSDSANGRLLGRVTFATV